MCGLFRPTEPPPPTVTDVRSPAAKAEADVYSNWFTQQIGKPQMGYQDQSAAFAPLRERALAGFKENVAQSSAEAGFDPLRFWPGVTATARGAQQMQENWAAEDVNRMTDWEKTVLSHGISDIGMGGVGQSVTSQQYGPSPFAALTSPFLGGFGAGVGRWAFT